MILCSASWTQKKADVSILKYSWNEVEHQVLGAKHLSKERLPSGFAQLYQNYQFYTVHQHKMCLGSKFIAGCQ